MEDYDLGKCAYCSKNAITAINAGATSLCAHHHIKQVDENCLFSELQSEIDETGKVNQSIELQKEIKKQKPNVYNSLKTYFDI